MRWCPINAQSCGTPRTATRQNRCHSQVIYVKTSSLNNNCSGLPSWDSWGLKFHFIKLVASFPWCRSSTAASSGSYSHKISKHPASNLTVPFLHLVPPMSLDRTLEARLQYFGIAYRSYSFVLGTFSPSTFPHSGHHPHRQARYKQFGWRFGGRFWIREPKPSGWSSPSWSLSILWGRHSAIGLLPNLEWK